MAADDHKKLGPRDVFLHLFAIITLYLSAINVGVIIFQALNIYLPDVLTNLGGNSSYKDTIRWAVASLVIAFPVYVWLNWFTEKELEKIPEKRELRTRKWLLYLTLFLAAVVIVADLITLVFNFLQGELTVRFVLKVITVFFISSAIFRYYLWSVRREISKAVQTHRSIFAKVVIAIVAVVTIVGFIIAGLPQSQRLIRLDERRVSDLEGIQSQVLYFWQQKDKLPQTLAETSDSLNGYTAPVDPVSNSAYEYRVLGDLKFEICANFAVASNADNNVTGAYPAIPAPYPGPIYDTFNNWQHPAGRFCFDRTIDPQLYGKKPAPAPVQ